MDLRTYDDFVARATTWLDANAEPLPGREAFEWGKGDDRLRVMGPADSDREDEIIEEAARWRSKAFDAGVAWPGGPTEYGGAGLDPELNSVYRAIESRYDVPDQSAFAVAWDMVGPAVLSHGSDDLKSRFLGPLYRGDVLCSQLLSEPEAGSDLAGLKTRAERDGERWVVNGQKVWNSYAHKAKIGQLLARTNPEMPKHQGLTMFLLPLDTPGVDVRPLRQMTGDAEFNEVFLSDVEVADENRVGEPGSGWRAVMTTLMSERTSVGSGNSSAGVQPVEMVTELARHVGRDDDPIIRQRLAAVHTYDFLIRAVAERAAEERERSGSPNGPEGSVLKLLGSRQNFRIADLAGELLGPRLMADSGEWGTYSWSRFLCGAPGLRIAGGTDEIQRNIVAERVLGLPR